MRNGTEKSFRALLAAVIALAAGAAEPGRAEPRALGGGVFADRIDGGPRLLLVPQRSVPMFSCTVLVPAGSALETPATNGAAHFLEHLLFNGTTARTREEIYGLGDRLGAYNNASTQRERTVFQLLVPSENWRQGLELQADMLRNSTLPRAMFEKEKGIILEELAKDRSDPSWEAELFARRAVWGDSPFSLPVLGSEESITAMDPDAVAAFYRERYRPAGFTIIVMGDFDLDEAREELDRLYAADGEAPAAMPVRPAFPEEAVVRFAEHPDLGKIQARLTFPFPARSSPDVAASLLLADVLGSGERSAVSRAVEAAGIGVLSSAVEVHLGEPWSAFSIAVDAPEGTDGAALVGAILDHLPVVARDDRIPADVETARLERVVEEISLREKMHYYGLMRADLLDGDPARADAVLKRLSMVLPSRLQALLLEAVHGGRAVATVAGPGVGNATAPLELPTDPQEAMVGAEGFAVERIPLRPAASVAERELRRVVVPDGPTFVIDAALGSRTFAVQLLFRNRAAVEAATGVPRGTSDVVHRMMKAGTADLDENELRGRLARLGAKLKVTDLDWIPYDDYYYSPEFSYVRLETIDSFALDAIALLGEVVYEPRLDDSALAVAAEAAAVRAEQDETRPRQRASEAFYGELGENHPLAGGVHGPADALRALSLDDVRRHHAAMVAGPNVIVAATGSVPADDVEAALRAAFGRGRTTTPPAAVPFTPRADDDPRRVEIQTGQEQSYIVVGAPIAVEPADEAAVRVAVAILSERLAERLREEEGLAYSIGAGVRLDDPGPNVRMIAGTRPENLERMERGMREVAASLVREPPSSEEVEGARNRDEGRSRMRRLSRIGQAYALAMAEFRGRDAPDADLPALAAVTSADVTRVADRYLRFDDSVCAIAR